MRQDPTCPNLKELYGDHYRIGHDPAAVTWGEKADPWMMTVRCSGNIVIYPFGPERLAVEIDYRPGLFKRVMELPGVELWQDGDGEKTVLFPLSMFDAVAEIVKPRRRRRLTPEQRAAATVRLAKTGFKKRTAT